MHCAHMGVFLFLLNTGFVFAQHGGARGTYYGLGTLDPRQSRTSWPQSFPGPALCAPPTPPSGPNALFGFSRLSLVCLPHLMVPSGWAPEASWPRSAFPASYHRGEHKSRTPVTRFADVRSEPPSHDGVSNLGYPRLLSWRGCRTSWSGTPFPKGAVEVVESVAS